MAPFRPTPSRKASASARPRFRPTAELLEDRVTPAFYTWNSGAGTLSITLDTNEVLDISESGGTRSFSNSGAMVQNGGDPVPGGGHTDISFTAGENLTTSISISNAGAGAGTNAVNFLGGTFTTNSLSVDVTQPGATGRVGFQFTETAIQGNVSLLANDGISLGLGTITVTGTTTLGATPTTDIDLANSANNFQGAVSVSNVRDFQIADTNAITFGATTISRDLLVSTSGAISSNGSFSVGGDSRFSTGSGSDITFTTSPVNFQGAVTIDSASDFSVIDAAGGFIFGDATISGALSVTAQGADSHITQTGAVSVATATFLNASGDNITLNNSGNDFGGVLTIFSSNTVVIRDTTSLTPIATDAVDVTLTADDNIRFNASLLSPNTLSLTAQAGADGTGTVSFGVSVEIQADTQSYSAGDGGGAFPSATVDLITNTPVFRNTDDDAAPTTFTYSQDAAILDANIPTVAQFGGTETPTNYTITSSDGSVTVATPTKFAGSNLTLNAASTVTVDASMSLASLSVKSNGAISGTGALTVTGGTTLSAGAGNNITLTNANNFSTVGITSGNNVSLNDTNALILGASTVSGTLNVTAGGTLSDSGDISVTGAATFTTGAAIDITLNDNNDFNSVVVTIAADVSLRDVDGIVLNGIVANGNLSVTANGAITDTAANSGNITTFAAGSANDIELDAANNFSTVAFTSGNNVTFNDANAIILRASTVSGTLNVTANGLISDSGDLSVAGAATFAAGVANNITLNNANDFNSVAITSGNDVMLNDKNALSLAASSATGDVVVTATNALTISGASSFGSFDATGTAGINLNANVTTSAAVGQVYRNATTLGAGNRTLTATGGTATFNNALSIAANTLTVNGNFTLAAGATNLNATIGTTSGSILLPTAGTTATVGAGRNLNVTFGTGFPATGSFTIINPNNTGITGTFANAPGGIATLNGIPFNVSYAAGTANNDLVLDIEPPTVAYVDDDWAGTAGGTNPANDPIGGLVFGYNAFADIQSGVDAAGSNTLVIFGGTYAAATNFNQPGQTIQVATNSTIPAQTSVGITGAATLSTATTFNLGTADLAFGSTIDSLGTNVPLAFEATSISRSVSFVGLVGGTLPLQSLTVGNAMSSIDWLLSSPTVTTIGGQEFNGIVALNGNATLVSTNGGAINFNGEIRSATARSLAVNTSGTTTFAVAVGGSGFPLGGLTTDAGGTTQINGGSVLTPGFAQTYNDAVTLGAAVTTLTGSVINFNDDLTLGATTATATRNLQIVGSLNLAAATTLTSTFAGTAPAQYGNIDVTGNTTYGNATLAVNYSGFTPLPTNSFNVVSNGVAGTGKFANIPSTSAQFGSTSYQATYTGSAGGGDFILTAIALSVPDSSGPSVTISQPSVGSTTNGPVTFTITYLDPSFSSSTLTASNVILNSTGTATGTVSVSVNPGSPATRTVTISNITGVGTLGISLVAGTASDIFGNLAPAAGPSTAFAVTTVVVPATTAFAVGGVDGTVRLLSKAGEPITTVTPIAGYTGLVSVALGDFNGDEVPDLAAAAANPAGIAGLTAEQAGKVFVYDGVALAKGTLTLIRTFTPFATSSSSTDPYTNGLNIAAGDIDNDGRDDLVAGTRGGNGTTSGRIESGRLVVIDGTSTPGTNIVIGGIQTPFSAGYQKGVIVAAGNVDGVGGDEIAVTRGGPVASTNPAVQTIKVKVLQLKGAALSELPLAADGATAFAPFAGLAGAAKGINRDGRVTFVDSNGDGKDELVFTALDPRTDSTNVQVRIGVYAIDPVASKGAATIVSTGADAGTYLTGTAVKDHATTHVAATGTQQNLALLTESAASGVAYLAPRTGAVQTGGFSLNILNGGITIDGI